MPLPVIVDFEWVMDNVIKYKSSFTSTMSIFALQRQLKLANPKDSCKIIVEACRSDDFSFLRAALGNTPTFFMYKCLFEVLGLVLPMTTFQRAMLEHLNMASSNSTQTIGPWWGPLRFCAPSSKSGSMCQFSCISSRWSWRARLARSSWIVCPRSCLSSNQTSFIASRTIPSRFGLLMSWLMVCHWCLTYGQWALLPVLLEVWPHQV